jgi:GT2 family glycosyltransferase
VKGIHAIRIEQNRGPAHGFNVGLSYALKQGADHVLSINNDTTFEPDAISQLVTRAESVPDAGLVVPKVNYYDHPDTIWSAGSRVRAFPPAIVMHKTRAADDGRFDRIDRVDAACYCVVLLTARAIKKVGLLDPTYRFYYEDYDHSFRIREAGFRLVLAPQARVYHKISKTGGAGTPNPNFWRSYGFGEAVFKRRFGKRYPWTTGRVHQAYVLARMLAEGHLYGVRPFREGFREGSGAELSSPPRWDEAPAPEVVYGRATDTERRPTGRDQS